MEEADSGFQAFPSCPFPYRYGRRERIPAEKCLPRAPDLLPEAWPAVRGSRQRHGGHVGACSRSFAESCSAWFLVFVYPLPLKAHSSQGKVKVEPGAPAGSPTWVARPRGLGPSAAAILGCMSEQGSRPPGPCKGHKPGPQLRGTGDRGLVQAPWSVGSSTGMSIRSEANQADARGRRAVGSAEGPGPCLPLFFF